MTDFSAPAAFERGAARPPGDRFGVAWAVAFSVLMHAVVLVWLAGVRLPGPGSEQVPRMIVVDLERALQMPEQQREAVEEVAAVPDEPEPEIRDDSAQIARTEAEVEVPVLPGLPDAPDSPDLSDSSDLSDLPAPPDRTGPEVRPADVAAIRAQVLARLEPARDSTPAAADPNGLRYAPAPALPGRPGWLNAHVGPVQARSEQWVEPGGEFRTRTVLASGEVICSRTPTATVAEFMQPWKYAGVAQSWVCGRERPEGPDPNDPRTRPPISASP